MTTFLIISIVLVGLIAIPLWVAFVLFAVSYVSAAIANHLNMRFYMRRQI